jgi:signal transduction histidine kinase
MNRRLVLEVATPAAILGAVLLGTCLVSAWYIFRQEANLSRILSENVASLEAAQELEIRVRQLRAHTFLYLIEPTAAHRALIPPDHQAFEEAFARAQQAAQTEPERQCIATIQTEYERYQRDLADLRDGVDRNGPRTDFGKLFDAHPIRGVTNGCHALVALSRAEMDATSRDSNTIGAQVRWGILVLGLVGPISGLLVGLGVARRLSRSVARLSIRVHDVAERLGEQDVASVSVSVDGDFRQVDRQLEHVLQRVEEVARRAQQHQQEMLRAEQLAAVGQLAASMAHEVRNPLTGVKLLVDAARLPGESTTLTAEDLTVIHDELARVEQTVQGFLDFARPPALRCQPMDLHAVLEHAVGLVKARARQQRVSIDMQLAEQPAIVSVDGGQLTNVLVNLFLNALDVMPTGGKLTVSVTCAGDGRTTLRVADTGPGITPEMEGRLFTPFASSKPTGTGLGLSVSRRIIEDHGGRIGATNLPDGGAQFTIEFLAASSTPALQH